MTENTTPGFNSISNENLLKIGGGSIAFFASVATMFANVNPIFADTSVSTNGVTLGNKYNNVNLNPGVIGGTPGINYFNGDPSAGQKPSDAEKEGLYRRNDVLINRQAPEYLEEQGKRRRQQNGGK